MRSILNRLEINAAVFWAILTRGWQVGAGVVSFILLTACLTDDERGYYVTFWSFVAFQSIVELGFTIMITNFSSHEWSKLSLNDDGHIQGDADALSRLVSLGRMAGIWFGFAAIAFIFAAGIPGAWIFAARNQPEIEWLFPWWATVALSSGSVFFLPFLNLLEGCGQIERVYRFRLIQAICTNLLVWSSLLLNLGLWTAAVSAGFRCISEFVFLGIICRQFFAPFWKSPAGNRISWTKDMWPVQWRLSVGGAFSYFAFFLFNPVLLHYHSPTLAGQMGMTRQLLVTIQGAAQSWIQVRVPEFGVLIARREFPQLDQRFMRLTILSTAALAIAGFGFLVGIPLLNHFAPRFGSAILGVWPSAIMLVGMLAFQLPFCQTQYLRAHKKEPVFLATMVSNITIGLSVWLLGKHYGAMGAASGYALSVILVTLPGIHFVWKRFRINYHSVE